MLPKCTLDLWEYLQQTNKTVVLYGMGNGADKILAVLGERGIPVGGIFASDGFARGNLFHGMPVRTWSDIKAEFGKENVIVRSNARNLKFPENRIHINRRRTCKLEGIQLSSASYLKIS